MEVTSGLVPVVGEEYTAREAGRQYLTLTLADETYGVDILRVQEIKGWTPTTHVPNSPDYMLGVLNLRGEIIPVVDLRVRFGMVDVAYAPTTVVIVLRVVGRRERTMGIVVDGVSDVLHVLDADIRPTPDFGTAVSTEYIAGLATAGERMIMLLDIDRLLALDELGSGPVQDEAEEDEEEAA